MEYVRFKGIRGRRRPLVIYDMEFPCASGCLEFPSALYDTIRCIGFIRRGLESGDITEERFQRYMPCDGPPTAIQDVATMVPPLDPETTYGLPLPHEDSPTEALGGPEPEAEPASATPDAATPDSKTRKHKKDD
ncbi:MAG: hypothetical protein WC381_10795 [Kiritimatiellia bacterium]|jgi:hypothetical protein